MGVHGFTTFVEGNRNFLFDVKFRANNLIIDGSSLFFNLYLKHSLDRRHGGDYDAFASLVLDFFCALRACNIEPYVLLDGGIDPSNKKFQTLQQRLQSRIREADNMSHGRNGSVLPLLTKQVFVEVLIQEKVHLVQCLTEADWDIACLAHEWRCPVLSNDSDFFIFDLPGGYMPLNFFQWTNLNGKASQRYIPARCYTTPVLCSFYHRMNPELLPLCAVLTGNDYGAPKEAEILLQLITESARNVNQRNSKSPSSRIDVLLRWLSSFSCSADALAEIKSLMRANSGGSKKKQKVGLTTQLEKLMKEYHVTPRSPLSCWFTENKIPEGYNQTLPNCLLKAAAQGLVSPVVVDALVMRRVLLNPQVENSRNPSSYCCARAIRQAIYGILLLDGKKMSAGKLMVFVEEFDRVNLNLKVNQVEPQWLKSHFHVDTLNKVPEALRCNAFFEVLRVNPAALVHVPANIRLAVAVTSFWLQEAKPKPSHYQLQALVMGMVYGELLLMEKSGIVCYQIPAPISKFQWGEEHSFIAYMDHLRSRSRSNFVDIAAAHSFSQWQACLWSALCLNQLLLRPIQENPLSRLFSGSLVHGILSFLKEGGKVSHVLTEVASNIYSTLLHAVKNCSTKGQPSPVMEVMGRGGGRRGRGRGRGGQSRGRGQGRRGAEEISNRFAVLEMNDINDFPLWYFLLLQDHSPCLDYICTQNIQQYNLRRNTVHLQPLICQHSHNLKFNEHAKDKKRKLHPSTVTIIHHFTQNLRPMGVRGLTTFVEGNQKFHSDVKFRASKLIIDASCLIYHLYSESSLDQHHGGEYDAFASLVSEFFSALRACNIEPYVLLDGGSDPTNKKFKTLQQRLQYKIREADKMSHGRNGSILPLLTTQVFIEVLIQEKVHLVQCLTEADWDIACLAHEWNCPVLSNDSDFFIFDLPGGYMPLNFFHWNDLKGEASERYIPARCYTRKVLCDFYHMSPELLPLFAVFNGNDYSSRDVHEILQLIKESTRNVNQMRSRSPSSRFDFLLRWLSSFSCSADALAKVKSLMRENSRGSMNEQKVGLTSQLEERMKDYHVTPRSPLSCWFTENKIPEGYNQTLPNCLLKAAAQGLISPLVVDTLVMRRVMLYIQVEDSRNPSSYCCARAIRQAIYGILLLDENQMSASKSEEVTVFVEEFDRVNLSVQVNQVEPRWLKSHFHVDGLNKIAEADRCKAIFEVLGVNRDALAHVPANIQLAVAVTSFWLQEAKPKPSHYHLQALVLGMVYGELLLMEESGIICYQIPAQIQWAEEHRFITSMKRLRSRSRSNFVDIAAAHSFSQWQACLWCAHSLNQLLLRPIQEKPLSSLFSGTLVDGILGFLKEGREVSHVLTEVASSIYSTLLHAVENCSTKGQPSPVGEVKEEGGGRKRRWSGEQSRGRGQERSRMRR
ncbi:uncharacterized protein aste1b isoform X2 [Corythoichthys intestinalis]|uniref:uncharacterized protein aste1b isoform X2 n=1 Tax=Corythoichthys intestinalis TaxID=161448 RepID=UPI0025A5EE1B|nr:uncharacterized protein aste1b isoform X2 [Corythoichthys intestinalis]XP_057683289.1 uncharacterized protein aste1b isoform X2 [Corythoichthys intestinalis]